MKKMILLLLLLNCLSVFNGKAQTMPETIAETETKKMGPHFGIKFGYNVAKLTGSSVNLTPLSRNGFHASAFYAPISKGLGYRTELTFSRQGFSFSDDGKMENVQQDYVYMPHLTTLTIAKVVQLQAGGQIGYLLNAKKETTTENSEEEQLMQYMNRLDYGAKVGIEIYPYKGLIIGGSYNISMGNPYKANAAPSGGDAITSFLPLPVNPADFKGKNAVIQVSVGYRF